MVGSRFVQWMGPEGWFQKLPEYGARDDLLRLSGDGPNRDRRGHAKELQRAHLEHMTGQAKIGKLVLAGPLVTAGLRRGLIAYRVPTMTEAVERASADPMVKPAEWRRSSTSGRCRRES